MAESDFANASRILNPQGEPARAATDAACPDCGKGPEIRVASGGFGVPHPVCPCGHEWMDEVFRPAERQG